ncbi:hypothetical protein [Mumia quercus]|uniref:hypothetical protein n=1 Tax=Mumia quercus TaxID=2976125 RepID=UPI0021D0E363|nr:hypothetical protein [Mumia quercus]
MSVRTRVARLAVVASAATLAGTALMAGAGSAAAAEGTPATGTVAFDCKMPAFPTGDFDYPAQVSLAGFRASEGAPVELRATMSDMPGVSPVPLNNAVMKTTLSVTVGGQQVTLEGSGSSTAAAKAPVPVPDVSGKVTAAENELAVKVTAFNFVVSGIEGVCTASSDLSTLTVGDGAAPPTTPPPTVPPTTAPTQEPTTEPPATEPPGNPGKPAKGKVAFKCELNIGSKFDYNADLSVSGYRAKEGDPVSLVATMSDLPGIAPVPIDGSMDFSVDLSVGGKATTLKANSTVKVPPKADVAVPKLKGTADAAGDELEVKASGFAFDFPASNISATCVGSATLSKLGVSSEPPDDDGGDGGDDGNGGGTGGDALPKTGPTDGLPVIGLWAGALVLLGAAGIILLPRRSRATS